MQREEKQLDATLEAVNLRVNDLKTSIGSMIFKLEHEYETINWPTFLDNFALISGHLSTLSKMISHDKAPPLRGLTALPLLLSPERDDDLARLTEGRVLAFSHDLAPDFLRTKPDPDVEHRTLQMEHKAASLSYEAAQKQVAAYSKVVGHVWDIVNKAREEWESEAGARGAATHTSNMADTHALVAAVGTGKGLKVLQPGPAGPAGMMTAAGRQAPPPGALLPGQMAGLGKAQATIKTNIKAAAQVHPYGR